jgi:hypothetical protein
MDRRLKQASAYLDPETYAAFATLSGQHQGSLCGHLKHIIEREIKRDDVTKSLIETLGMMFAAGFRPKLLVIGPLFSVNPQRNPAAPAQLALT